MLAKCFHLPLESSGGGGIGEGVPIVRPGHSTFQTKLKMQANKLTEI